MIVHVSLRQYANDHQRLQHWADDALSVSPYVRSVSRGGSDGPEFLYVDLMTPLDVLVKPWYRELTTVGRSMTLGIDTEGAGIRVDGWWDVRFEGQANHQDGPDMVATTWTYVGHRHRISATLISALEDTAVRSVDAEEDDGFAALLGIRLTNRNSKLEILEQPAIDVPDLGL